VTFLQEGLAHGKFGGVKGGRGEIHDEIGLSLGDLQDRILLI